MKAIILAGGEGTRLRPITERTPKPLARLCGKPILEYVLELLAENGIDEAAITLGYGAQMIASHFACDTRLAGDIILSETDRKNGRSSGVVIRLCVETTPLGTAGSVRKAATTCASTDQMDNIFLPSANAPYVCATSCIAPWNAVDPVLIISGDALCDFSLKNAIKMHYESGAAVTIVTTFADDPREYGLVRVNENGRVIGFVEKPSYTQATDALVNTGIYILSQEAMNMIPDGEKFDFAKDLFPLLMKNGSLLQSCLLEGYWRDIGDLHSYRCAQSELLLSRVNLESAFELEKLIKPQGNYSVTEPVYFGAGVQIGDGAIIGAYSVLDEGCTVSAGAEIDGAILLPNSFVGQMAIVKEAVICENASIGTRASILQDSAIGADAIVGVGAYIYPNVRVASGARVESGLCVRESVFASGSIVRSFDDDGLCGEIGAELTAEVAVQIGCAIGSIILKRHEDGKKRLESEAKQGGAFAPPRADCTVGAAHYGGRCAAVLGDALIAGIRSTGVSVMDFGEAFESLFGFAMGYNALSLGIHVCTGEKGAFKLLCDTGLPATRVLEREIEQALSQGAFSRAAKDSFGDRMDLSGIGVMYQTELLRLAPDGLDGMRVSICTENKSIRRILCNLLENLGCDIVNNFPKNEKSPSSSLSNEKIIEITISEDGKALSIAESSFKIGTRRCVALYCAVLMEKNQDVAVENDFPHALDVYAGNIGRRVYRYLTSCANGADERSRNLATQQQCLRDGLMLCVLLLDFMRRRGLSLQELDAFIPDFATEEASIAISGAPARLLEALNLEKGEEGMLEHSSRGVVMLRPRKNGSAIRIFAEAASWEIAHELCDDFKVRIQSLLDKKKENGYNK